MAAELGNQGNTGGVPFEGGALPGPVPERPHGPGGMPLGPVGEAGVPILPVLGIESPQLHPPMMQGESVNEPMLASENQRNPEDVGANRNETGEVTPTLPEASEAMPDVPSRPAPRSVGPARPVAEPAEPPLDVPDPTAEDITNEIEETGLPRLELINYDEIRQRYHITAEGLERLIRDGDVFLVHDNVEEAVGYPNDFFIEGGVVPGLGDILRSYRYREEALGDELPLTIITNADIARALLEPQMDLGGQSIVDRLRGLGQDPVVRTQDDFAEQVEYLTHLSHGAVIDIADRRFEHVAGIAEHAIEFGSVLDPEENAFIEPRLTFVTASEVRERLGLTAEELEQLEFEGGIVSVGGERLFPEELLAGNEVLPGVREVIRHVRMVQRDGYTFTNSDQDIAYAFVEPMEELGGQTIVERLQDWYGHTHEPSFQDALNELLDISREAVSRVYETRIADAGHILAPESVETYSPVREAELSQQLGGLEVQPEFVPYELLSAEDVKEMFKTPDGEPMSDQQLQGMLRRFQVLGIRNPESGEYEFPEYQFVFVDGKRTILPGLDQLLIRVMANSEFVYDPAQPDALPTSLDPRALADALYARNIGVAELEGMSVIEHLIVERDTITGFSEHLLTRLTRLTKDGMQRDAVSEDWWRQRLDDTADWWRLRYGEEDQSSNVAYRRDEGVEVENEPPPGEVSPVQPEASEPYNRAAIPYVLFPTPLVRMQMGITEGALESMLRDRKILGIPDAVTGEVYYPGYQFAHRNERSVVIPGVAEIVQNLTSAPYDTPQTRIYPAAIAEALNTRNTGIAELGEMTVIDYLRTLDENRDALSEDMMRSIAQLARTSEYYKRLKFLTGYLTSRYSAESIQVMDEGLRQPIEVVIEWASRHNFSSETLSEHIPDEYVSGVVSSMVRRFDFRDGTYGVDGSSL